MNIKQHIWQKTCNELQCNDFRKHSASVLATGTVKINFLWTIARSKMFYVLWRICSHEVDEENVLWRLYSSWGRFLKLCLVPKRRVYEKFHALKGLTRLRLGLSHPHEHEFKHSFHSFLLSILFMWMWQRHWINYASLFTFRYWH